ncbi:MAG TPA: prepilin-type N-terminal cleavage/methylation domain-containing protein [Opitutaceae bacterium]|nr:prepilin-type N-terminal cleavage/methylation domain-containing protein [Opitutaceae bacterium]
MSPTESHSGVPARCLPGFSLVELMIAMSITMVIIAAILSSYTFLGRNLIRDSNQQQLEAQSRRMLQALAADAHTADRVAYSYDPANDINQESIWLAMPTSGRLTFRSSIPNGSGGTYIYAVTYVYDSNAGTLTRTVSSGVSSGTPPSGFNATPLVLLTGLPKAGGSDPLWTGFGYLDQQCLSAANTLSIKAVEVSTFTIAAGSAAAGTQSRFTTASARLVLRNKHLVR